MAKSFQIDLGPGKKLSGGGVVVALLAVAGASLTGVFAHELAEMTRFFPVSIFDFGGGIAALITGVGLLVIGEGVLRLCGSSLVVSTSGQELNENAGDAS